MKIKVGDKIKIDKKKCGNNIPLWYNEQIYTITEIKEDGKLLTLDRNLPNLYKNKLHVHYVKLLNKERKKKLKKLKIYI